MHCTLRRRHFGRIIIGKVPCDDVVSVALLISSSDAPPIRSLRVCASDWISDPPVLWINSWNWLSTFSKWDFVEMEYPVRDVAAFRSPPMILRRPSDLFISVWMWVFTRFWRSSRLAVAWWMLIMLIRSPSCVIASSHKTRPWPWAMCFSAFFSRGLCQFTTSALGSLYRERETLLESKRTGCIGRETKRETERHRAKERKRERERDRDLILRQTLNVQHITCLDLWLIGHFSWKFWTWCNKETSFSSFEYVFCAETISCSTTDPVSHCTYRVSRGC